MQHLPTPVIPNPPAPSVPSPALLQPQQQSWHAAAGQTDVQQIRARLTNEILHVFSRKKGSDAQAWTPKIRDFVKRLECELWRRASSQEEYLDLSTLETRLKTVATQMNEHNRSNARQGQALQQHPAVAPGPSSAAPANPMLHSSSHKAGLLPSGMMPAPGGPATGGVLGHAPPPPSFVLAPPTQPSLRSNTPYGMLEDNPHALGNASSSGLPTVSSGLLEGGMLGGPSSVSNPYSTTLTPSGAPVLLKRSNSQRDGSYGASNLNVAASASHRMHMNGAGGMIPSGNGMHSSQGAPGGFVPTSTMVPTQSMGGMVPVDSKTSVQQSASLMGMPPVPGPLNPVGPGMVPMGNGGMMGSSSLPQYSSMPMGNSMPMSSSMSNGMGSMPMGSMSLGSMPMGSMPLPVSSSMAMSSSMPMSTPMPGSMPMSALIPTMPSALGAASKPNGVPMPRGSTPPAGATTTTSAAAGATSAAFSPFDNISLENTSPQFIQKQQRWLLFLRHCAKCRAPESECQLQQQCRFGKQLWEHILTCSSLQCEFPRCSTSKELLKHHQKCTSNTCPICHPVKEYVKKTRQKQSEADEQQRQVQQKQQQQQQPMYPMQPGGMQGVGGVPTLPSSMLQQQPSMNSSMPMQTSMPLQASMPTPASMPMVPMPPQPPSYGLQPPLPPQPPQQQHKRSHASMMAMSQGQPSPALVKQESGSGMMPVPPGSMPYSQPQVQPPPQPPYPQQSSWEEPAKRVKTETDAILSQNTGTSLLETFTYDQILTHKDMIYSAQQQQRNAQLQTVAPNDYCKVCGCTKLLFEPNLLYCSMCGLKIKRGQTYYTTPPEQGSEVRGNWCHPCFMDVKQDRIPTSFGSDTRKADLIKKKNDEEIEEPWVACDGCQMWVHQVCGLFNKGRNNQDVHYLCPDCLLEGLKKNMRRRIENRPQAMLEAKDLPQCELSKYLENRIGLGLQKEREARAMKEGRQPHELPTAEQLTVRVVNSVIKKVETKPKFFETFSPEGFPPEFPYRQRVVLLFQKLDGVDVCIFCMYVQEYGNDCPEPNRNCVYLSYLDSIKYFRPSDLTAVQPQREPGSHPNIALRTYVYHQMLIGYLSFVKMLGFEQMYIWACPPMQGDDYILYCHPNKQKTPRSDRLRHWYLDMLRLAKYEGVVLHLSTLWDTYFPGGKDHRMERCSVTQIPYLQGDYWPGEAENLLTVMAEGNRQAGKNNIKSGGTATTARKLGKGKRYGGGPESIDEQLMDKLGELLGGNMKDDFIVVHLQEVCTFCRRHIRSNTPIYRYTAAGGQLRAPAERKFEGIKLESGPNVPNAPGSSLSICEACYYDEETRHANGQKPRLPASVTPKLLHREVVKELPVCMDPSQDVENEYFETRESFLNLCQTNHYQFDTLRRAKHSSMMVLYYLHNPHAPAFSTSCNLCHIDIEPGTGWHCNQCPDFDICASCKNTCGHPHPLTPQSNRNYDETRMRLTDAERKERNEQLQKTMALLVHACSCQDVACQSTSCRKVRQLFQHAVVCQQKVTGGCPLCKKMWCLLNLHAKSCTRADCPVPRCKEIKDLRRRQMARQEEKRRFQYQAMLRNQQQLQAKGK